MTFSKQPLVWLHVLALAIALGAVFGFSLSADQAAAVMAFAQAVAVAVGWTQVTPNVSVPTVLDPSPPVDALAALVEQAKAYRQSISDAQAGLAAIANAATAASVVDEPGVPAPDATAG